MKVVLCLLVLMFLAAAPFTDNAHAQCAWSAHQLELRNTSTDLDVVFVSVDGGNMTCFRAAKNPGPRGNWLHTNLSPGERRTVEILCLGTGEALDIVDMDSFYWSVTWVDGDGQAVPSIDAYYDDPCMISAIDFVHEPI